MKRLLVVTLFAAVTLALILSSLAAAQIVPTGPLRVDQNVMSAQIVKKVAPEYPAMATQARIQGSVVLKVRIDKAGDVQRVELFSGHPILAPAAFEAVKQWKYRPYLLNGAPVEVETTVIVNFTLSD